MSKASEWAKVFKNKPTVDLDEAVASVDPLGRLFITEKEYEQDCERMPNWFYLSPELALRLGRWIIATFADEPSSRPVTDDERRDFGLPQGEDDG